MRLKMLLFCTACSAASSVYAAENCGDLANGYGPFDYRTQKAQLKIVEDFHFDSGVEQLRQGRSGTVAGDIDYVLRASPNHHRALMAMERLSLKSGVERLPHANYTVTCYFDRAVRFRPDDATVRMLYAHYLAKRGKPAEAVAQLQEAEKLSAENGNLQYNMGLAYLDLKDYDKALAHAHRAYQLGFPLPGLRTRLEKAGKWRDPQVAASATPEAPAATHASVDTARAEAPKSDATAPAGEPGANP
jgi:tetratricopeptide (TPR) repeat protein